MRMLFAMALSTPSRLRAADCRRKARAKACLRQQELAGASPPPVPREPMSPADLPMRQGRFERLIDREIQREQGILPI